MSQNKLPSDPRILLDVLRSGISQLDPDLDTETLQVAIVASRFNSGVVDRLIQGAVKALTDQGLAPQGIALMRVPGAWELPLLAKRLADSGAFDGIIALGCVVRGETAHFDVIVNESGRGLMQVSLDSGVPISNGVLACEDEAQAIARAGGALGNKGEEAANALLELIGVIEAAETTFDMIELNDGHEAGLDIDEVMDAMEDMRQALEAQERKKKSR